MEILLIATVVLIVLGFILRNKGGSNNALVRPPSPSPTPKQQFDKQFSVFSLSLPQNIPSAPVDTKIQFMADGSVVSDAFINGQRAENSIGIWNIEDFKLEALEFVVSNKEGENISGPDNGAMNESPEWVMSSSFTRAGQQGGSFILTVTDGDVTKQFKVSLFIEVPDLRL